MSTRKIALYIVLITSLGSVVRLWQLDKLPNSLSADEVAFGYNAYSILKTGKDEFGHHLPLYFQSFDDYKNPVFGYILIPFIYLRGLSDWAIRFPSALSGAAVILLMFFITQKITRNIRLSLVTALLASVSPWLIQYSRVAIEMELALFLTLLGVWIFLEARNRAYFYPLSAIVFGLSFYTYHSSKVWTIFFGMVLFFLSVNYKSKRFLLVSTVIFLVLTIPYFTLLKTAQIGLRPYAISVFSNRETYFTNAKMIQEDQSLGQWTGRLIHNRRLVFLSQAINGFLGVLNPQILFSQNEYNHPSVIRLFYLWQLPFLLIGIVHILRNRKMSIFILGWLLIGLVPGGLTIFPPFDRRILLSSFPLLYLTALGLDRITQLFKLHQNYQTTLGKIALLAVISASIYIYLHNYFIHGPHTVFDTWGNGSKDVVTLVGKLKQQYEQVIVSIRFNQPLIFFLYYEKYSPEKYLSEGGTISGGYLDERNNFDKYRFTVIKGDNLSEKNLYVWHTSENQPCLTPLQTVFMTDGKSLAHIGIYNPQAQSCQQVRRN